MCDADEWDGVSCDEWDTNCGSGQDPEYCGSCDSDGDTCTGCDSACYSGETCSNCNSGDSCISCNVACYAEENCDACDTGCQNGENCTNCNSACESCNVCDGCDTYCDNSCEGCQDCQSSCEECNDCQTGCQVSCETGCEVNCEETCESSCESACEGDCQTVCQTSCQSLNTCDNKNSCSGGQTCNTCDSSDAPIVPDTFTIAFDYINRKDGSILADRTTSTAEEGSFVIPEPASRVLTKNEKDYVLLDSTNAIIEGLGVYSVGDTIQLTSSIATDGVIVIKYQYRSTQSIKTGWLTTHDGTRFAPKTAVSQMEGVLPIEKGGTGVTSLSALQNLIGGAKLGSFTYTGTGATRVSSSSYKINALSYTFPHRPILLLILDGTVTMGTYGCKVLSGYGNSGSWTASWNNNTVTWKWDENSVLTSGTVGAEYVNQLDYEYTVYYFYNTVE